MQPEHKTIERSQPEPLVQYSTLLKHYLGTLFVHAGLRTGQGLSTKPTHQT